MPALTHFYRNFNNTPPLGEQLVVDKTIELKVCPLFTPISFGRWILVILVVSAVSVFFGFKNSLEFNREAALISFAVSSFMMSLLHLKSKYTKGLKSKITTSEIHLPHQIIIGNKNKVIVFENIEKILVRRARFRRVSPDVKQSKLVSVKQEKLIYTKAIFTLRSGEKIGVSRINLPALADVIDYVSTKYQIPLQLTSPLMVKVFGLIFAFLFIGFILMEFMKYS